MIPVSRPLRQCAIDSLSRLEQQTFTGDRISRRSFSRFLKGRTADGHGLFVGDELVAYSLLLFRRNSRMARIYSLAVDRSWRGRGLGRQLVEAAADIARRRGCDRIQLEVAEGNRAARTLYESLGYVPVASRPGYYENGDNALIYQLQIGKAE